MRRLFLSCEHGGHQVPTALKSWFKGAAKVLSSHRGWDPGALDLFDHLKPLADASISNRLSRLCIEFNREEGAADWFSEYTNELPPHLKDVLVEAYENYRQGFADQVQRAIGEKARVLHLSVHSFTPELNGTKRNCDIGLLFDPKRKEEKAFCADWAEAIRRRAPGLRVRMNYPYRGTSDGFTRTLRECFAADRYLGIELEVNQHFAHGKKMHADIKSVIHGSLSALLRA